MSNIALMNQDVPDFLRAKGLSDLSKSLASSKASTKRIAMKNGIFRKLVNGVEQGKIKGSLDVIIVNAQPAVGRTWYATAYDANAEARAPDCWSADGRTPDASVKSPQASRCDQCQQDVKGSGQGNTKACRYQRRIALMLVEDFGTPLEGDVYQLSLSATSIFGRGEGNTHPFNAYLDYLINNGRNVEDMITQITFNEDNDNQSVLFTPTGYIPNQHVFDTVAKAVTGEESKKLVTMTVYEADKGGAPKLEAPKAAPIPADPAVKVEAEAVDEPTKRPSKKAEVTDKPKGSLASVVSAWSDDEE